jgi:hypothetical protein
MASAYLESMERRVVVAQELSLSRDLDAITARELTGADGPRARRIRA